MKTPTLLLSLTLSLVAAGCIDTKDVGVESDASSGGSSSGDSGASMTSGASAAGSTSSAASDTVTASGTSTTTATASGTATAATQSGGDTGVVTMATATASGSDTDSFGGSESSSGSETDGGEEALCEASGGGWVLETCGHFVCGLAQDCQAVIPGCDCGEHQVFVEGLGCQVGAECEPYEFDCGEELCLAPNHFCDVSIPGVKGPTNYECIDMPVECEGNYSCACLDAQGLVEPGECEEEFKVGAITVTTAKP